MCDFLTIFLGRAVENGNLRGIYFYQTVVDTGCIQSREGMLDSAYLYVAFSHYSTTLGSYYILCYSINYRFAFEVSTLYLVAMAFGSRAKLGVNHKTGMKPFAMYLKGIVECTLFHFRNLFRGV